MKISKYKRTKIEELKRTALVLYKEGYSLRQVGAMVGMSHQWVNLAIKELDNDLSTPKDLT